MLASTAVCEWGKKYCKPTETGESPQQQQRLLLLLLLPGRSVGWSLRPLLLSLSSLAFAPSSSLSATTSSPSLPVPHSLVTHNSQLTRCSLTRSLSGTRTDSVTRTRHLGSEQEVVWCVGVSSRLGFSAVTHWCFARRGMDPPTPHTPSSAFEFGALLILQVLKHSVSFFGGALR